MAPPSAEEAASVRFDSDFERVMALPPPSRQGEAVVDATHALDAPMEPAPLRVETVDEVDKVGEVDKTLEDIEEETKRLIWLTERVSDSDDPLAAADLNAAERLRHAEATAGALLAEARRKADALIADAQLSAAHRRAETEEWRRAHIADADKVATQRLLDAEYRARDIIEEARTEARRLRSESDSESDSPSQPDRPPEPARAAAESEPPSADKRGRRGIARMAKLGAVAVVLVIGAAITANLIRSEVAEQYTVASSSMEPELHDGDRVVVNKVAYRFGDPQRGDVVVLDTTPIAGAPPHLGDTLVKRVVGLPGDVVEAVDGRVRINGAELDEPWLGEVETPAFGPVEVPDDTLFVLGDARVLSIDSRTFGAVPTYAVIGRVEAIVWPPHDAGRL